MNENRLNILHVVPTYVPAYRYGGTIHAVHGLCKALVQLGHRVTVYTTNVDGDSESDVAVAQPVDVDGVTVYYFPVSVIRRLYYSPSMKRALSQNIMTFDVLHTHSVFLWPTWVAARFAKRHSVPYLMSPHGMLSNDLINKKSTLLKRTWLALIEKNNLQGADSIIATSSFERQQLQRVIDQKVADNKIAVIANGLDLAQLNERSERLIEGQYILYLGRINWKKGLDRLISAMQTLPGMQLVVAGNDEEGYWQTLQTDIKHGNLQTRIHYLGQVGNADKNSLLHHACCLVLASHNENFGIVVIEALANQCPVVVTDTVGAAQIVKQADCGIVIDNNGDVPKQLVSSIQHLLNDETMRKQCVNNGYKWVIEHNDWANISKTMTKHYEALIN